MSLAASPKRLMFAKGGRNTLHKPLQIMELRLGVPDNMQYHQEVYSCECHTHQGPKATVQCAGSPAKDSMGDNQSSNSPTPPWVGGVGGQIEKQAPARPSRVRCGGGGGSP